MSESPARCAGLFVCGRLAAGIPASFINRPYCRRKKPIDTWAWMRVRGDAHSCELLTLFSLDCRRMPVTVPDGSGRQEVWENEVDFRTDENGRRLFIAGLGAAFATGRAGARQCPRRHRGSSLAPKRGNWDDQFDAQASQKKTKVGSTLPIFSPQTASNIEAAIVRIPEHCRAGRLAAGAGSQEAEARRQ